jgi:hypothetical protein
VIRIAAVVVSLLLGGIAGLTAAALQHGDGGSTARDPLRVGIPMVNQACTGDSVLVIGRGDNRAALRTSIVNAVEADQAHYLEVARSCDTAWTRSTSGSPDYVVYLGPYPDASAACEVRMTTDHLGDSVTRLAAGNETSVKCPCQLPSASMPTLRPGMHASGLETMWVKQLQGMLVAIHRLREKVDQTGVYDQKTQAQVRDIQAAHEQPTTGVLDATTWSLVLGRACQQYDY